MVSQEHFDLLGQGVDVWNQWKKEHSEVIPEFGFSQLSGMNLREVDLTNADLGHANLQGADLTNADLGHANLQGADLTNANLSSAQLDNAILIQAIIIGTNLSSANLSNIDLSEAQAGFTVFANNDLREVRGLDSIHHIKPSSIGIDTVYRSQGHIPVTFLRRAGVPDTFLAYRRALVNDPTDYHTCFISYSSKDDVFARRLYNDLQVAGVRCWFAPEDMRVGANIHNAIDESIHYYDKLLLILSKNSVESSWVRREAEVALERENQERRTVLFPIRLDDSILKISSPLSNELSSKHIADFGHWGDKSEYRKAVSRLIRDLKVTIAIEAEA